MLIESKSLKYDLDSIKSVVETVENFSHIFVSLPLEKYIHLLKDTYLFNWPFF
jgi:hypothetical protein